MEVFIIAQTIEERVQARLNSWALKYDVPKGQHIKYFGVLAPLLLKLYSDVHRGERPAWMDQMAIKEEDTFTLALNTAETSYCNMYETEQSCKVIKKGIDYLESAFDELNETCHSLNDLALTLKEGLLKSKKDLRECNNSKYNKDKK